MGRPSKALDRRMRETRDLVLHIVNGEFEGDVQVALAELRERSPRAYLEALAKLMPYAIPRMEAVQTTEGKPSLSWMSDEGQKPRLKWFTEQQTPKNHDIQN